MKREIIILLAVFAAVLFYSCGPLEGSEVIGPGGGYVFYDKGSYDYGWRYLESAPKDAGELFGENGAGIDFAQARELADIFSYGGHNDWRLPTDDEFEFLWKFFLNNNTLINNHPPDKGGLRFHEKTYYITSDGSAYSCVTTTTTNAEGKKKWDSTFVLGSGKHEDGCKYIAHPIREF